MRSRDELIASLQANSAPADRTFEDIGDGYEYQISYLCDGGRQTRSIYIVGRDDGYFRENICGANSRGGLEFAGEATLTDPDFGAFRGLIYNSRG